MKKSTKVFNEILFLGGIVLALIAGFNGSLPGTVVGAALLLAGVIDQGLAEIKAAIVAKSE